MIDFSDEEKQLINNIGEENVDYVVCALLNHRNEESVVLDESNNRISVEGMDVEVWNLNSMLDKYTETNDPMEAIQAGVAIVECSVSFMNQVSD